MLRVDNFDIIFGNPPYNSGGIKAKSTDKKKREQTDSETIWPEFVKKSLILLKNENSYLLFIHPGSWTGLKSTNGEMILTKQLLYLRFYNYKQANNLFTNQAGKIPLTYYLLQNVHSKNDTEIYDNSIDKAVKFNIYENNFVPTVSINMMKKLYDFNKKYGNLKIKSSGCRNSRDVIPKYSSEYKYPIVSIAWGKIEVTYSKINNNKNNEKKLLLANSSMGYPVLDVTGLMYPSSAHQFIMYSNNVIKELKQLQNYFYTSFILYIINITKTSQNFFDNKVFEIVPDITKITDE